MQSMDQWHEHRDVRGYRSPGLSVRAIGDGPGTDPVPLLWNLHNVLSNDALGRRQLRVQSDSTASVHADALGPLPAHHLASALAAVGRASQPQPAARLQPLVVADPVTLVPRARARPGSAAAATGALRAAAAALLLPPAAGTGPGMAAPADAAAASAPPMLTATAQKQLAEAVMVAHNGDHRMHFILRTIGSSTIRRFLKGTIP